MTEVHCRDVREVGSEMVSGVRLGCPGVIQTQGVLGVGVHWVWSCENLSLSSEACLSSVPHTQGFHPKYVYCIVTPITVVSRKCELKYQINKNLL